MHNACPAASRGFVRRVACAAISASLVLGAVPATAFAAEAAPLFLADDSSAELLSVPGTAEAYVDVALEQPDGEPAGGDFNKYNFESGLPWCGHFAVWCARQAGVSSDVIPDVYNCDAMVAWFQQRGQWHDAVSYVPEPGDLIFYTYGYGYSHVGIVVSVEGGVVHTKEGNVNYSWCGQVGSFTRPLGTSDTGGWGYIGGYASPAFPDSPETHIFTDTPKGDWYVTDGYLDYVVENGLMGGYSDGSGEFGPDDYVTRGQLATVLYRAATGVTSDEADNNVATGFSDVPAGSYAAAAVAWASANGVTTGYKDAAGNPTGVFGVDDPVTREQIAAMLLRCADSFGLTSAIDANTALAGVTGADGLSDWAVEPMAWCIGEGIFSGSLDIRAKDPATRAEMAKIVTVFDRDIL